MEAPGRSSGKKRSVSSQLIGAAVDLLALYNQSGKLNDPRVISQLCVTLTRGIDHAIANNEVPIKSCELPTLLQKIDVWKHDLSVVIPFMLLMMSVKIACENGWFQKKETDNLLALAYEVKQFFSTDDVLQGPCHALPSISQILSRYYPRLKIENTLCSTEVKPGHRTIVADFNLSRGGVASMREMIGMIVARVDDIDTSSCIISPQEVDILLNGKGVLGRNNTSMEPVPQLPTDVTAMLKYGVNLLQAIGNFNGPYIIVIAVMCVIPTSDTPQLQDYVQPVVASGDTDIEMALQTSLNCPISKNRMRTPIKGHLCKHMQCFDYDSYLSINSRRPYWRCPLCDEPVSCTDIRIDQNIAKVLREGGEYTDHVLVSKDGSWKAVSENINPSFRSASKTPGFREEKQIQSNPIRKNPSRDENYSQQISPATNVDPSSVNNMHQNTCISSSLAVVCTKLNDQGNKNSRIMDINPNGMSAAMSPIIDCRGCHSLQKDTEPKKQSSRSCINTLSSANPSSMQGSVSQVNSLPVQNSNAYILPTAKQNGYCQKSRDTDIYQNLNSSSNGICEAVRVQQVHPQKDGKIQASLTAVHNRQPSVSVPCTKQPRQEGEQKQNMHREKNQVSRKGGLVELPSEGWKPSGKMRGSLQGQAYVEAYRQFIKQPTQPVRASELPSRLMATQSVAKSQSPNIKASAQATTQ